MQTVSEAKYTYWHSIIDIAAASGLPKEEWCIRNKIAIKTFNHYERVFQRQAARGYVYRRTDPSPETENVKETEIISAGDVKTEAVAPVQQGTAHKKLTAAGKKRGRTGKETDSDMEHQGNAYVEIPMCDEVGACEDPVGGGLGQVVIRMGGFCLNVGEGVDDELLRRVLKAVGGNA